MGGNGGGGVGRSLAQGVYNNTFFMHSATALVGSVVEVRLRSGNVYEGVFRTFSGNFDIALELPACIKARNLPDEAKTVPKHIIFPADTVVTIIAKDFDSQYATAGAFQTDGAISDKCNGKLSLIPYLFDSLLILPILYSFPQGTRFDEKELEPWDSGANGDIDIELDGAANGWDANEMFRKNENQFGVTSTFDDSLSSYTVALDKGDSLEFKEAEAKAEKLAAEIENNPTCRERLDLENGDEEALFAAVERPAPDHELDRERERERNDRDREREREREERERERERERDRDRDRGNKPRGGGGGSGDYQLRETMSSDRYITKQPRNNNNGPPPSHGGMSSSQSSVVTNSRDRDSRDQNIMTAPQGAQSAAIQLLTGSIKNTGPPTASANVGTDAASGSKYLGGGGGAAGAGGSMIKRKTVPQGGKIMRGNAPNSVGAGNATNVPQNNNANNVGGKSGGYQSSMSLQNQYAYQGNSQIIHG